MPFMNVCNICKCLKFWWESFIENDLILFQDTFHLFAAYVQIDLSLFLVLNKTKLIDSNLKLESESQI